MRMQTYYFDMKDGIPVRDNKGVEFPTTLAAIKHSEELARRLRDDKRPRDRGLSVVVIDETGREIHREPVYPEAG